MPDIPHPQELRNATLFGNATLFAMRNVLQKLLSTSAAKHKETCARTLMTLAEFQRACTVMDPPVITTESEWVKAIMS